MDLGKSFRQAWEIATLQGSTIREVADDPQALVPGIILLALAGVAGALGSVIVGSMPWFLIPVIPVVNIVIAFIGVAIYHLLALLFGGKGQLMPLFRTMFHAGGLVGLAGIIPFVGGFISLVWGLICYVIVVEEVHQLSRGKAVVVVLIPIVVCCALSAIGLLLFGAAIWSAISAGQGAGSFGS